MFEELKQRNVFKAAAAYVLVAWLLLQICSITFPALQLPDWTMTLVTVLTVLGFPFVLMFAWALDLTPDGVKSESKKASLTLQKFLHSRQVDFVIIGLLAVVIFVMLVDDYVLVDVPTEASSISVAETIAEEPAEPATAAPAIARATPEKKSIAVLPFVNMSSDKEQEYFSDGLSEEILNLLAKNRELKVAGRTSSFAFKGRLEDLRGIGRALDVATVLEGSVRKSGVKLRITAQLINVADGYHIWSETYDREMTDIFEMQDDIAAKILEALEIHLGAAKPGRGRPTENMLAYEKYLAAKAVSRQGQWDTHKPIELLKEVVALDPAFAEAWEFLAQEYWSRAGTGGISQAEAAVQCLEAAQTALELEPTLSIARALAIGALPDASWHSEIKAFEKAYPENPDNISLGNALVSDLLATGYFSEALPYAEHVIEIDPLSAFAQFTYNQVLYALGRIEEAEAVSRKAQDLGGDAWLDLFISHMLSGDINAAVDDYEIYMTSLGKDPSEARAWVTAAGDPETGHEFLVASLKDVEPGFAGGRWAFYLAFGHLDDFFDELEANFDLDELWTDADPIIQNALIHRRAGLAAHPRYVPFMKLMTITDTWDARGPPEHCDKESGEWVCE